MFYDYASTAKTFLQHFPIGTDVPEATLTEFLQTHAELGEEPKEASPERDVWVIARNHERYAINDAVYSEEYDGEKFQIEVKVAGKLYVVRSPDVLAQTSLEREMRRIESSAKRAHKEVAEHQKLAAEAKLTETELATSALTTAAALLYGVRDIVDGMRRRMHEENVRLRKRVEDQRAKERKALEMLGHDAHHDKAGPQLRDQQ